MEIKSSLLNDKDFALVKESLIKVSEIDNKEKFRVRMLEYINDTADNNNDMFFYDMLEFSRFLNPSDDSIAYTTPEKLIYLNAPGKVGESVRVWDFIYCHECLHQLWDTFAVGDKIQKEGIEYDHYILNIASDCVINDYLAYSRKKEMFEDGISPKYLKEKYDIDYDRKNDTQYSLYLKLLERKDELKKDEQIKQNMDDMDNNQNQSSSPSSSSSSGSSSGSSSSDSKDNKSNESANDAAKRAQDAADKAKNAADKAKENGDKNADELSDAADKAQKAADEAKEAADKANKASKDGDKSEEEKQTKNAQDAADKAEKEANKVNNSSTTNSDKDSDKKSNEQSDKDSDKKTNDKPGNGKQAGDGEHIEGAESDVDIEKLKKKANDIIEKYKNKLSGDFGTFISKCKSSVELKKSGLSIKTTKGVASWNESMNQCVNAFVKKKVFQKKRQYETTYTRLKRGSGFVKFGQPIDPGKKIKEEKLTINVAFYIDRSGSMGNSIDNVFDACYIIAESLKKQFSKEKVVDEVSFKVLAFDTDIQEIKFGKKCTAGGGTMSFQDLLKNIKTRTNDYLINVIITDAEFDVNSSQVSNFLKDITGMVVFITNNETPIVKEIANKQKDKLFYILADHDFTIKK